MSICGVESSKEIAMDVTCQTVATSSERCCCGNSHFHPPPLYLPPGTPAFLRTAQGEQTDRDPLLNTEAEKCSYVCWRYDQSRATWVLDSWSTLHKLCKQISVIGLSCHPPRTNPVPQHHALVAETAGALLEFCPPATGVELGSPVTSVVREFTYVLQYVRQWQVRAGLKPAPETVSEAVADALRLTTTLLRHFLGFGYSANEHTFHRHLRCDTPLDRIIFMIWNIHIHDTDFSRSLCGSVCRHLQEVVLTLIQHGGVLHRWRHVAELFLFRPSHHRYYMDMFLNSSSQSLYHTRLKSIAESSLGTNDYCYPGNAHEAAHERKSEVHRYVVSRMTSPRTLKQLTRLQIYQTCQGRMGSTVNALPLPHILKYYLLSMLD